MSPIVTNLEEWGARAWDELNASEALSVHLAATILHDHSTQIQNPDFIGDRRMFTYCQWQLLTAAAPSALALCSPPTPSDSQSFKPSINITLEMGNRSDPRMSFEVLRGVEKADVGDWTAPPKWFRGCLITLCYRLDTPDFVKAEVYRMIQALKAGDRNEGVGLIFDGRNVVGVAFDGMHVQHSPALPIYNHQMRPMEGFRLMMHLLGPCLLSEKTPWRPSVPRLARSALPLPMEIIIRITQFLDYGTYNILPLVSYSFRRLYFDYPRFGNIILLQPTQLGAFHVFDTVEQQKFCAYFCRDGFGSRYSTFRFCHRQQKLSPKFFTPIEYAQLREEFRSGVIQNDKMRILECPMMAHMVRLVLQVLGKNTPGADEPLIPEDIDVSMQVVWGAWSLEKISDPQDDGVWYRYHVAGPISWPTKLEDDPPLDQVDQDE